MTNNSVKDDGASQRLMKFECVEIYVPKKLENLSQVYNYLQKKLFERTQGGNQDVPIDGFSLYEVDGAFYGQQIYQERTLVIRILFIRTNGDNDQTLSEKIHLLGREVAASVSLTEEEFWICHYPQNGMIFRPSSLKQN